MNEEQKVFNEPTWCILELFGHQRLAGEIREVIIGDTTFIRLDIPKTEAHEAVTRFYNAKAIYGIHPTSEEICRRLCGSVEPPVNVWELAAPQTIEESDDVPF